jgi:hypothetical protein
MTKARMIRSLLCQSYTADWPGRITLLN